MDDDVLDDVQFHEMGLDDRLLKVKFFTMIFLNLYPVIFQ